MGDGEEPEEKSTSNCILLACEQSLQMEPIVLYLKSTLEGLLQQMKIPIADGMG